MPALPLSTSHEEVSAQTRRLTIRQSLRLSRIIMERPIADG
jgi:hypothetical protein